MNNIYKKSGFLAALCLGISMACGPLMASGDDGVGDVFAGVALTGAAALGVCALGSLLFHPSEHATLQKAEDLHDTVYATYKDTVDALEQEHGIEIASCTYQEKQAIIHNPSEKVLGMIAQTLPDTTRYCAQLNNHIDQLLRHHKKIIKGMRHKNGAQLGYMKELAEGFDELITQLSFLHRYIKTHAAYADLYTTAHSFMDTYQQELALCSHASISREQLRTLIMTYGQEIGAAFPYLAYADVLARDKRLVGQMVSQVSPYPYLASQYQELYNCLDKIQRAVLGDDAYAQALRDKQLLEQQEQAQRQQEAAQRRQQHLIAENNRLMAELAREQSRNSYVVVEHQYTYPVVQPVVTYEYVYDDYDYYDYDCNRSSLAWFVDIEL